jgi:hypothetical protein
MTSKAKMVQEDGWTVIVDRDSEYFAQQLVSVQVLQRVPNGETTQTLIDEGTRLEDAGPSFKLPAEALSLIGRALLDSEPASERLTNKLESLLDREADRVDRLIALATESKTVNNHLSRRSTRLSSGQKR